MVRIQLESGYLDVKEGTSFPLNFQVGDIRNLSERKGTFSKTITLIGSKNNNTLLNNYYDVNVKAGTFDINKLTKCTVLQNNIPIVTDALLQLVNVKKVQLTDAYEQGVEYEVLIKDSQAEFYTTITNKELTDLDFSDCNHEFNITAITNSWSYIQADHYKYIMGWNDNADYTVNHFKPAIYAKSYFDRIFAYAGFTYQWDELETAHFDKLLIPYNGDVNNFDYTDYRVIADTTYTTNYIQNVGVNLTFLQTVSTWTEVIDVQNLFNPATGIYSVPFNTDTAQGQTYTFDFTYNYEIILDNTSGANAYLRYFDNATSTVLPGKLSYKLIFRVIKNGVTFGSSVEATDIITFDGNVDNPLANGTTSIASFSGTTSYPIPFNVNDTDTLEIQVGIGVYYPTGIYTRWENLAGTSNVQVNPQVNLIALDVDITPSNNIQVIGGTQIVNEFIPQKIKQSDFIKAIFQMYNLYAYPDINQPNKLILVHRDEWYDSGTKKDWTRKLAKNQEQELIFLPDLTNKKLKLTYKPDTDSANTVYTQATAETYGQIEYTFQNEYVKDTDTKELLFSPTPVNKTIFNAYLPTINGIAPNNNIRILYDGGLQTCLPFNIYEQGTIGVTGLTEYPQTGHFDNALTPTFDINYGVCDYYLYQTSVLTNNNLYNLYWRRTVNQINVGKMLIASFYLRENDIQTLKLNDKIRIDNSWWNINKIIDYNANDETLTKVELISVDSDIELAPFQTTDSVYIGDITSTISDTSNSYTNRVQSNVNLSAGNFEVYGKGNVIGKSLNGIVIGDNLSVTESGVTTTNLTVTETINGKTVDSMLPTYTKYIAHITQSATSDPVVTILENNIEDVIVWTRNSAGQYEGAILTSLFSTTKTYLMFTNSLEDCLPGIYCPSSSQIFINTMSYASGTLTDNLLIGTLEIRIYP